jgi:hypothetical protein
MKIQMQMGIPTLYNPSEPLHQSQDAVPFAPQTENTRYLLLGTDTDPHLVHVDNANNFFHLEDESEKSSSFKEDCS